MLCKVKSQMTKIKNIRNKFLLLIITYCLMPIASNAQCAMCRASLESTGDKVKVEAVNDGIVFLMAIPYILVAGIGFVIYKMYYKKTKLNPFRQFLHSFFL
jgi:heme/copper-type cytochrome/quinol oxidase subunit 2